MECQIKNSKSFPHRFQILFGIAALVLIGCQNPRETGRWYQTSPSSHQELGVIVSGASKSQIQSLNEAKQIGARTPSGPAGTYEIYGVSMDEAKTLFPGNPLSPNAFVDFNDPLTQEIQAYPTLPEQLLQLEIIQAPKAWQQTKGANSVISVIDTGIAWNHLDFDFQKQHPLFNEGWNFGDGNKDLTDLTAHGTAVAGLIASSRLGVAPEARIIPLKVINSQYKIDEASVIAAIRYSLEHNILLIHFSLGKPNVSEVFLELMKDVERQGALVVAAAGNQSQSCEQFRQYPAGLDSMSVLSVGATLLDIQNPFMYASYSNFGDCVAMAAPGGISTLGLWAPIWQDGQSYYRSVVGTSMAAPLVSGAAALLQSIHPEWKGPEIRSFLLDTTAKSNELWGYVHSQGLLQIKLP